MLYSLNNLKIQFQPNNPFIVTYLNRLITHPCYNTLVYRSLDFLIY
jgi:hypothetical protein